MEKIKEPKKFLTIKEFANEIGVHRETVWRWTVSNKVRFFQVGINRAILIPFTEIDRILDRSKEDK